MQKRHSIVANGTRFTARTGELLLDSALTEGVQFPHDCRVGRCGSCLARVTRGTTLGGSSLQKGMVHACQARVFSDLEVSFEDLPPVGEVSAVLSSLHSRCPDVVEVGLRLSERLPFRPGQYFSFKFRGYPARPFSPTLPADGSPTSDDMTLHVKRVRGGRVSTALGNDIVPGHRLKIEGPFGSAFYRPGGSGRLVLVAGGTGFAPILSIASAALNEKPEREIVLVVGARAAKSLYMAHGLVKLQRLPNVTIIATAVTAPDHLPAVRPGGPESHVPQLTGDDTVYAAGAPSMIEAIAELAERAGADFYSDPFEASVDPKIETATGRLAWPDALVSDGR